MPALICNGCGGLTNTACSDHLMMFTSQNRAIRCFAKMVDKKWVNGCGYEGASIYEQQIVDRIINGLQKQISGEVR